MTPTQPVLDSDKPVQHVIYTSEDPDVQALPTVLIQDGGNTSVVSRWTPTPEERAAIAAGGDVWVWVWTFGQPLQPIAVTGTPPEV